MTPLALAPNVHLPHAPFEFLSLLCYGAYHNHPPIEALMTPAQFIAKWRQVTLTERSDAPPLHPGDCEDEPFRQGQLTTSTCLYYYLVSQKDTLIEAGRGGAQPDISHGVVKGRPIPPLNEQKRIADKLDNLLKRVDTCRERLDRAPLIVKRFRQAVLAVATSGALTEEWRDNYRADVEANGVRPGFADGDGAEKGACQAPPQGRGEGNGLPEGWNVNLSEVAKPDKPEPNRKK